MTGDRLPRLHWPAWLTRQRVTRTAAVVLVVLLSVALAVVVAGLGMTGQLVSGLLVLGAAMVAGLLAVWALVVPGRLAPPLPAEILEGLGEQQRVELTDARLRLQNDIRTTALQAIAGLAVLAGAILAFQQLAEDRRQAAADRAQLAEQLTLTRQGQTSERFTTAIQQLASTAAELRIGGIYGLEQIARQAPDQRLAVTEVLVAYVRQRATAPASYRAQHARSWLLLSRAPDVQAALTVLGRRQVEPGDPFLPLHDLDLGGVVLDGANLSGVDLTRASLRDASLGATDLTGAYFGAADLTRASLRDADLTGGYLAEARLAGAYLEGADLSDALLGGAVADASTRWPDGFDWRAAGVQMS